MVKVEDGGFKFFNTPVRIWQITRRRISEDSNVLGAEFSGASARKARISSHIQSHILFLVCIILLHSLCEFLCFYSFNSIRLNYQLDAIFVYFSSTCFGLTRPSSGAIEFIISFTNAAYGVLGAARCRS